MDNQNTSAPKPSTAYKKGDTYVVPPEGSLGLLALGYQGLVAWRKAQEEARTKAKEELGNIEVETELVELPVGTDD